MAANGNLGYGENGPGTNLFIIQVIFLAFAWVTFTMRAYVKLFLLSRITTDDWLMLLGLIGYTATAYFVLSSIVEGGVGKAEMTLKGAVISLRSLYFNQVLSGPVSGLIRASIAVTVLRISVNKWHRRIGHVVITLTTTLSVAYFFVAVFQCSPPSYFWMRLEGAPGFCTHILLVPTAIWGVLSALMDWIIGFLPIAILWNVQLSLQTKFNIVILFSIGIVAGIALILRVHYIVIEDHTLAISIWAIVEFSLGIIAGCVATSRPFFKKISASLSGVWRSNSPGLYYSTDQQTQSNPYSSGRSTNSTPSCFVSERESQSHELELRSVVTVDTPRVDVRFSKWEVKEFNNQNT